MSKRLGRPRPAREQRTIRALARALASITLGLLCLLRARESEAQVWSDARTDPLLWQIIAIDRSGEPDFPYGREDVAGDGLASFSADEAKSDLRTVYVDADANRLWLRAYVAGSDAPGPDVRVFFFIDDDGRDSSGGAAAGAPLDPMLGGDPTAGGYERAISVGGDGALLGLFAWSSAMRRWLEVTEEQRAEVIPEAGSTTDPLGIGSDTHGYVQLQLTHAFSGLTQSCGGKFFVRVLRDGPGTRDYADDAPEKFACRAEADPSGGPIILRPGRCGGDDDCPADGVCRSGVCLYAYACASDADCPEGHACTQGRCVRVVNGSCSDDGDCDGLVCDGSRCAACSERGARACADDLTCSPDGSCVDPRDLPSGGGVPAPPGKVRGGAFSCAATRERESAAPAFLALIAALVAGTRRRRSARAERSALPGEEP